MGDGGTRGGGSGKTEVAGVGGRAPPLESAYGAEPVRAAVVQERAVGNGAVQAQVGRAALMVRARHDGLAGHCMGRLRRDHRCVYCC